ncbi:PE domain-containing protein [Amycolatopsis sp. WGS_07]|uniref:PE domain-containing protein n=1 Tax=Amycolatopsis sp. WGS_07 TaxID=3076764 RepID=UPI003872C07C
MGNGESSSSSQPVNGRAGYVDPEEQAKRDRQDKQYGEAMNSTGTRVYQQRAAEDAKVNAAAAGGGFNMDIDAMRKLQPKWQEIADKLDDMAQAGGQLKIVPPPADDPASTMQKKAADGHADAYVASLQQQRAYAQGYADKLKDAIAKYEKQDHANTTSLRKQG